MPELAKKSIVLVGGGHTHALVLNTLRTAPLVGADVIVINPGPTAPYSGMLPGFVAGHYARDELDINLVQLCKAAGARLIIDKAVGLDLAARQLQLETSAPLDFDIASFDVGITSQMHGLKGFQEFGIPAKPLDAFSHAWDRFRDTQGRKHVTILGGGIAGAELAMAMRFALQSDSARTGINNAPDISVTLIDRSEILGSSTTTTRQRVLRELSSAGVGLMPQTGISEVTATSVKRTDGSEIPSDFTVGAAGATPHDWVARMGLDLENGFITVDRHLETSASGVFAVGDCAHMAQSPRPKAGVYAVRQAPVLLQNLRNLLTDKPLTPYAPQADYLKLVSLGGKRAFGEKRGFGLSGRLVWRLKDRIDRKFMDQFETP